MGRFGAVVTAMITPFDATGGVDLTVACELSRWLEDNGSDALVVAGTTGEAPVLSDAEKIDLWRAVSEAVDIPVIAGSGTADTKHSIELTRAAEQAGVAGALVVAPYYNRPSQAGLFEHFRSVAGATSLPVMIYDIPARTGRKISSDTILRLAREVPNVVALKDAAGDVTGTSLLLARAPGDFDVYSGDDALTLPLLAVGAVGVVSVASHWVGPEIGEMISAFSKGDVERARELNAMLVDAVAFQSSEAYPNPLPAKAVCRALGFEVGQCRLPLGSAPTELDDSARKLLESLAVARRGGGGLG